MQVSVWTVFCVYLGIYTWILVYLPLKNSFKSASSLGSNRGHKHRIFACIHTYIYMPLSAVALVLCSLCLISLLCCIFFGDWQGDSLEYVSLEWQTALAFIFGALLQRPWTSKQSKRVYPAVASVWVSMCVRQTHFAAGRQVCSKLHCHHWVNVYFISWSLIWTLLASEDLRSTQSYSGDTFLKMELKKWQFSNSFPSLLHSVSFLLCSSKRASTEQVCSHLFRLGEI